MGAVCSPGMGYDTSTSLFYTESEQAIQLPLVLRYLVGKLTRWDGIYFVQSSRRGYLFEQEWAFGWGFTRVIALCSQVLRKCGVANYVGVEGLVAICIAHLSHLLSVLAVFDLTRALFFNYSVTLALRDGIQFGVMRRLLATGLGGMCVGAGFLIPQYIAYSEYCEGTDTDVRPWCQRFIPSIYTFVQDYYWNCGFLRYWTVSNLPLFLLATPMFYILTKSGSWALSFKLSQRQEKTDKGQPNEEGRAAQQVLQNLAFTQLALVALTLSTAHVQIITRISSAFPVWLWYGAIASQDGKNTLVGGFVRFMVIYALVQGGLYASFLPPA